MIQSLNFYVAFMYIFHFAKRQPWKFLQKSSFNYHIGINNLRSICSLVHIKFMMTRIYFYSFSYHTFIGIVGQCIQRLRGQAGRHSLPSCTRCNLLLAPPWEAAPRPQFMFNYRYGPDITVSTGSIFICCATKIFNFFINK